jgi:hypothetical protein
MIKLRRIYTKCRSPQLHSSKLSSSGEGRKMMIDYTNTVVWVRIPPDAILTEELSIIGETTHIACRH